MDPEYCARESETGQEDGAKELAAARESVDGRQSERGARQCLLKGCEQWFEPGCAQCRYCSDQCRQAARDWSRWRAQNEYRQSEKGKGCRRAQSQRHRERRRRCAADQSAARAAGQAAVETSESVVTQQTSDGACVGHQSAEFAKDSEKRCCDRPGCYEKFVPRPHDPPQRFCSGACRKALRRVEERERRWRLRRQQKCRRLGRRK